MTVYSVLGRLNDGNSYIYMPAPTLSLATGRAFLGESRLRLFIDEYLSLQLARHLNETGKLN